MRTAIGCSGCARLYSATARWSAMPQRTPERGVGNATRKPSPRSSTSKPPCASQWLRTIALWSSTIFKALRSPRRSIMPV
jgi:predicted Fe-S protein YdhL (DUF1289 family)